ncbi:MAG: hypothetical protein EPO20_21175 [Betaproteobacteria bacterium]|nr:MAG: hypothetical protein EPO20_21175 [Betaproteobacteria bacterium]
MRQLKIPAVFMRGGTSNAVVFNAKDLPRNRAEWDEIFLAAIGSPDPYGRQLDGMGGGISSLSKVCVVGPSSREDADIDYTFAQVQVKEAKVDYSGNCGNMSSAVGPFAVDEGLVKAPGSEALVRIHNTNTKSGGPHRPHDFQRATAPRAAGNAESEIRIAMPSGVLTVGAKVGKREGGWYAEQGAFFRTQRRMFEGHVLVRASCVPRMA